jgi:hypothetical protein
MTRIFLLAPALLGFIMKLVALLQPATASNDQAGIFWLLVSPNTLRHLQPAVELWRLLLQMLLWFGALLIGYQIYWWLVGWSRPRIAPELCRPARSLDDGGIPGGCGDLARIA